MSYNTFGRLFRVTTFGESHGAVIGAVVDGCPPGLPLAEADIQPFLDLRKPGASRFTSQRREPDQIAILSGVFGGVTTGAPIALEIRNADQRPKDYAEIAEKFRPGHADYTYFAKYGVRDWRGGGRASARETAARVAAGAIARKILGPDIGIFASMIQMGSHGIDRGRFDRAAIRQNPFFCADPVTAEAWAEELERIRKSGSSIGAVIECAASGVPAGWGAPIYAKLDADLAAAFMSINAVKGVEIGDGFAAAAQTGEESADEMRRGKNGRPLFLANHAGGILGGISTGQDIVVRMAVKPTSSIPVTRKTIDSSGNETEIATKGRHDPCVGIRAVPVAEAMMACVLADHKLMHRAQCGQD